MQKRFHIQLGQRRTTLTLDTILAEMLALKLGVKPNDKQARSVVRKWLEETIKDRLGHNASTQGKISQRARLFAIEAIAEEPLRIQYKDWIDEQGHTPSIKTTTIILWLRVENNSKFVRGKGKTRKDIEDYYLYDYHPKKLKKNDWEYELTFHYADDKDLEDQIGHLIRNMHQEAESRNGFIEYTFTEVGTDREWY